MRIDPRIGAPLPAGGARARQPWMPLLNAVLRLAGPEATLLRHGESPWASVTFSGSRHALALAFAGPDGIDAAETFIAALPDHEFAIPGQLVADAAVTAVDHALLPAPAMTVEIELLLLEER